jgi:small-conductance mechanosensitive channel
MVEAVTIKQEETTAEQPVVEEKQVETKSERPDWLPEKFANAEEMAKSYTELETKIGQPKEETPKEEEAKPETLEIDKTAEEAVEAAGLDMTQLQQEYNEKGALDEKSYNALEKAGIPKDYVNQFIHGQEAIAQQLQNTIKGEVGGAESYTEITSWAKDALSPNEITAFNKTVNSGDLEAVRLAVTGLKARHDAVNGTEPRLVSGKATSDSPAGYNSWAQVTAAMKDARYENDPAFRDAVQNKISKSNL